MAGGKENGCLRMVALSSEWRRASATGEMDDSERRFANWDGQPS
jgi:hypothetical protein